MLRPIYIIISIFTLCIALQATPPNVIVILLDDLGYADLGYTGSTEIPTPNIDELASEGVIFTNAYSTSSMCAPSRAGLITGYYQNRFGFEVNDNDSDGIPPSTLTIAEYFKQLNYTTGIIGKWHLGDHSPHLPLERGFDYATYLPGGSHRYTYPSNQALNSIHKQEAIFNWSSYGHLTDFFSAEAVTFIEEQANEPFFLYFSLTAPHGPFDASQADYDALAHIEGNGRREYAGLVTGADRAIGAVINTLKTNNLYDNTLIFFTNDHGNKVEQPGDNSPFRGGKTGLLEGGIHVPFVMVWKDQLPAGQTFSHPVIHLDILPTAMNAADGNHLLPNDLDGVDLMPHLLASDPQPPHDALFWRLKRDIFTNDKTRFAMLSNGYKLVTDVYMTPELFYLSDDLEERNDLQDMYPDVFQSMLEETQDWMKTLRDPNIWRTIQAAQHPYKVRDLKEKLIVNPNDNTVILNFKSFRKAAYYLEKFDPINYEWNPTGDYVLGDGDVRELPWPSEGIFRLRHDWARRDNYYLNLPRP